MHQRQPPRPRSTLLRVGASELVKQGVTRFDIRDPYHFAITLSWRAFALLFLSLEFIINVFFALLYLASPDAVANLPPGSFAHAFFFSLETLATVGYGTMAPATLYGHIISTIEIVCGLAFTAIMTGLLFVRFSKPKAKILYATTAVVTRHNGRQTLMLRIGNGRQGVMTHATVTLGILLQEVSSEGQIFRRLNDLPLARSSLPMFLVTWTLMHEIDEYSPIYGYDAKIMADRDVRLFLTFEARDQSLGTQVHDLHVYGASDIQFGMRYCDAITVDADRRTVADFTRISLVEPDIDVK